MRRYGRGRGQGGINRTNQLGFTVAASALICAFWYKLSSRLVVGNSMKGKKVIVTGANTGIGYAISFQMASKGAEVVMACRDISKGKAAAESLLHTIKDAKIEVRSLDLTNFRSMRTFVKEIDHCDILVNNAGAMFPILDFVSCGSEKIEKTFMTNYLGPFYLTISLLPIMGVNKEKASDDYPERRIVNVGSRLEKRSSLRDTMKSTSIQKTLRETFVNGLNGNGDSKYNMWTAYANSKLCNLLFTYELSRRLTQDSYDHTNMRTSNIVVNAVTPGMVNTNLSRWLPTWQRFALAPILPLVLRSPNQGAEAVVRVATSPALKGISGRFFDEKETPFDSSAASQSKEIASSLWEESVRLIRSIEREIEEEDRLSAISNGQR